ncbi:MAG: hypothetical protein ABSF70_04815 [Terracidiphilus sp.]
MADYARLADHAKVRMDAEQLSAGRHRGMTADPKAFFEKVKANVFEEMNKANVELRRRGVATIDRNHLPGFSEEIFLTYGTHSLCRVALEFRGGRYRITAVLSGPPNGYELSRKEYPCKYEMSTLEMPRAEGTRLQIVGIRPERIAADIISSIVVGAFD